MSMAKRAGFNSKIMKVKYGEAETHPIDRAYMIKVFGKEWADEVAAAQEQESKKKKPTLLGRILKIFRKEVR